MVCTLSVLTGSIPASAYDDYEYDLYHASKKNPLIVYLSENDNGWICLNWINTPTSERYTVYIYNEKKEKYYKYESGNCRDDGKNEDLYITDPIPEKEYKFLVRMFDKNDEVVFSKKCSITTRVAVPTLTISRAKGGKPVVTWNANSKMPTGCELYVKEEKPEDTHRLWDYSDGYSDWRVKEIMDKGFVLAAKDSENASGSVTLRKDKDYTVIVRTYYIVNGKKEYSNFSEGANTGSPSSYVNGLTLDPKFVCRGEEAELVKKYVDSVITADMTNYEKLEAVYELVNSHGTYQTDINKIDGNRPVWQIMEKQEGQCASWAFCLDAMLEYVGFDVKVVRGLRESGQQHFWCQIEINGEWYNIDAHVGYFLTGPYKSSYLGYSVVESF